MSLAAIQISQDEWDLIYDHILSHRPKYQNMHMREARIQNKKRGLRYLHAMMARPKELEINGVLSGPDIFCRYTIIKNRFGKTQINVLSEKGSKEEKERLAKRFLVEILNRVEFEKENPNPEFSPKRTEGEFYLKRRVPGMPITHKNCQAALKKQSLDKAFLQVLEDWRLALLHP
jgi:hypothetical protein